MNAKCRVIPEIEALADRILPSTTAIFSNGMLLVQGGNAGNDLMVSAQANGTLQVTDHGANVAIAGTTATLTNTKIVVELSGSGHNNFLSTDKSLGSIATDLDASLGTNNVIDPGNTGPSTQIGGHGLNYLLDNPGGGDLQIGGGDRDSQNLFDWEPGTGTDTVIGRGSHNSLLIVGNNNGQGENDQVIADGHGGFIYQRLNLVAFNVYASDIQDLVIRPSSGNNTVTVNNLTGVEGLQRVEVDSGNGNNTVTFAQQRNSEVKAIIDSGTGTNTYTTGAGPTYVINGGGADTVIVPPHSGRLVQIAANDASAYVADFEAFLALKAKQ